MSTVTHITAEDLARLPDDGFRYELVAGELRKLSPAGWKHGNVVSRLHAIVAHHIYEERLGEAFGAETGFLIARNPDTVRAPDFAFIHQDHLPADPPQQAYWPGAPDLAVEVLSPGETVDEVNRKVEPWLKAGCQMVWVLDPASSRVTVYRSTTDTKTLAEQDTLEGEDVVPGFHCRVGDFFTGI